MRSLALIVALFAVACSSAVVPPAASVTNAPPKAAEPVATPAPTPLPTNTPFLPVPTPTPAAVPAPLSAISSTACRHDPAAPPGVYCLSTAYGDVDGDGRVDRAVIWGEDPNAPYRSSWYLAVVLATGSIVRTTVTTFDVAALRGIADVNHDGRGLILFHESHGASTEFWEAVALVDGQLRLVQDGDHVLIVPMYGSVAHGGRFACVRDTQGVALLSVVGFGARSSPVPWVFDWSATNYRIVRARATAVGTAAGVMTQAELDDPSSAFNRTWGSPWDPAHPGQCGLNVA